MSLLGKKFVLNDILVVLGHSLFCEFGFLKGGRFLFRRKFASYKLVRKHRFVKLLFGVTDL